MKNKKVSPEEKHQILLKLATGGYTMTQIGEMFGLNQSTVSRIVSGYRKQTIEEEMTKSAGRPAGKPNTLPEVRDEIINRYKTGGYTVARLARMYNLSERSISTYIKNAGIDKLERELRMADEDTARRMILGNLKVTHYIFRNGEEYIGFLEGDSQVVISKQEALDLSKFINETFGNRNE